MIERALYNYLALPLGLAGFRGFALFNAKARRGVEQRKTLLAELKSKTDKLGPGKRVLVHVSSVGEYLQARPILRLLRKNAPTLKIILSFYSPSLEPTVQKGMEAEFATYLPFDRPDEMAKFLDLVNPALIIFSCYDLWPNLIWQARARGIKVALVNANLAGNSGKLHPLASWWFGRLYRELDLILAASDEDRRALAILGANPAKIITTGNARFDETVDRIRAIAGDDPVVGALASWKDAPVFAIGSCWPEDEAVLLPALEKIWAAGKNLKIIMAPHEIEPGHIKQLSQKLADMGAGPILFSEIEAKAKSPLPANKAVIIDSVGKLYKLYKLADLAFVGGSFRKEVHNVMEPAAFGIPVLLGPNIRNSLEALKLTERKGAFVVQNTDEMFSQLRLFLDNEAARRAAGRQAAALVRDNQGAGEWTTRLLLENFPEILGGR